MQLFFKKTSTYNCKLWNSWSQELCQKTDSANIVSEMLKLVDDASVARWLCGLTTAHEIGQCYLVSNSDLDMGTDHHPIGYLY